MEFKTSTLSGQSLIISWHTMKRQFILPAQEAICIFFYRMNLERNTLSPKRPQKY